MSMPFQIKKGTKVVFSSSIDIRGYNLSMARKLLIPGNVYIVGRVTDEEYFVGIHLEEFPEIIFSSTLFETLSEKPA